MSDASEATPAPEPAQELQGVLDNEQWQALVDHVDHLVREMERLPDKHVKGRVFELLQGIDALHREALLRLVRLFKEGVLEKVITDPAIHTLMELYDLLPREPDDAARNTKHRFPNIPIRVEHAGPKAAASPPPHWIPALAATDAPSVGETIVRHLDGHDILLCRVKDHWFAVEARCATGGAPLDGARLTNYTLVCPSHAGCFYDIRQGSRIGGTDAIACLPVRVDDQGRVQVGFGMPFTPQLPSY